MLSHSYLIEPGQAGERLDRFLAAQLPEISRSRLQEWIRQGDVTLNAAVAKPGAKLAAGDRIELREPPTVAVETLPEEIPLHVLYEDADLIVIDKPAGLVVHPAAGNWTGTVVNALLQHCGALSSVGGEQRPGIVHRLDKETSGCLLAAKNDLAHRELARQFAERETVKIYLALAAGRFAKKSGMIEAAIARHPVHRQKMAVRTTERARAARTEWRVVQEIPFPGAPAGTATVVECRLHTGRTHQIRVHLQHLGHPLLGDEVYGRRAGFARQMLHAWKLSFRHPRSREMVHCEAPLPADFLAAGVVRPMA